MEKTREPKPQELANDAAPVIGERINALERQRAEQSAQVDAATGAAARPMTQGELSAELERHRDQLREYEKALVERIADVDDDRRATASRLQRAWQTQREEIDERLRRNAGVVAGLLVLFAALVAAALYFVYRQATSEQPQLAAEVAEIRQQLDGINAANAADDKVRKDLAWLSKDVEEVAVTVERLVDGEQKRVAQELKTVQEALEVLKIERTTGSRGTEASVAVGMADSLVAETGKDLDSTDAAPVAEPAAPEAPLGAESTDAEQGAGDLDSEEKWVVGEGSYALQLIGFHSRDSLAAFAKRDGLPTRVYYLRQTYKDRPWFALIHSVHQGYTAAADELSRLPEDLVALNPWLRPLPVGIELQVLETGPGR